MSEQRQSVRRDRTDKSNTDQDHRRLLQDIAAGDREALRRLYDLYYHDLIRFIFRITRRLDLAEEAVNDTMLVVWEKAATFRGDSRVSTWIMAIANRKGLKLAKKSNRLFSRFLPTDNNELDRYCGSAEPLAEQREMLDWLDSGLATLSADHRAVIELTYYFGCSYNEIATILGCPVNTVKTRMFHARRKLGAVLSPPAMQDTNPK